VVVRQSVVLGEHVRPRGRKVHRETSVGGLCRRAGRKVEI
jgi:hypothetical protein